MHARLMDWRDGQHWGGRVRPCITCLDLTPLLNDDGEPQHKVCAEEARAIEEQQLIHQAALAAGSRTR